MVKNLQSNQISGFAFQLTTCKAVWLDFCFSGSIIIVIYSESGFFILAFLLFQNSFYCRTQHVVLTYNTPAQNFRM